MLYRVHYPPCTGVPIMRMLILWILGVPLSLLIVLKLFGVF